MKVKIETEFYFFSSGTKGESDREKEGRAHVIVSGARVFLGESRKNVDAVRRNTERWQTCNQSSMFFFD